MTTPYVKGLNTTGGSRTFRFEGKVERDLVTSRTIARQIRATHERSLVPSFGEESSFFRDELDKWHELDITGDFKHIYAQCLPYSRSLAQLIHHKHEIIECLLTALSSIENLAWKATLALLSVLARDIQEEMYDHYDRVMDVLRKRIETYANLRTNTLIEKSTSNYLSRKGASLALEDSPEIVAEIFRTLAFLFRYLGTAILKDPKYNDRFNEWVAFLGNRRYIIREMTAASLAILLRQHNDTTLKHQINSLLKGLTVANTVANDMASGKSIEQYHRQQYHPESTDLSSSLLSSSSSSSSSSSALSIVNRINPSTIEEVLQMVSQTSLTQGRSISLRDGIARLFFELVRSGGGHFHSKTSKILNVLHSSLLPKGNRVQELYKLSQGDASKTTDESNASASTTTLFSTSSSFPSLLSSQLAPQTQLALFRSSCQIYQGSLSQRADIVGQTLRYICIYTNATDGELVLNSIHDAIETGLREWTAIDNQLQALRKQSVPPTLTSSTTRLSGSGKRPGKSVTESGSSSSSTESTVGKETLYEELLVLYSLSLGQYASMLHEWIQFGNGARIKFNRTNKTKLIETLKRLTTIQLWSSEYHTGVTRLVTLRLLSLVWKYVCIVQAADVPTNTPSVKKAVNLRKILNGGKDDNGKRSRPTDDSEDDDENEETSSDDDANDDEEDDLMEDDEYILQRNQTSTTNTSEEERLTNQLSNRLLDNIFSITVYHVPKRDSHAVATAITAAMTGVLLPRQTEEGLVYPNVTAAGSGANRRVVHVASLDIQSLLLSFSRDLLVLATKSSSLSKLQSTSILKNLLPHLSGFILPLLSVSLPSLSLPSSTDTDTLLAHLRLPVAKEVVWSLLLTARDAILPRGSRYGVNVLLQNIAGLLSSTGRLKLLSKDDVTSSSLPPELVRRRKSVTDKTETSLSVSQLFVNDIASFPTILSTCLNLLHQGTTGEEEEIIVRALTGILAGVSACASVVFDIALIPTLMQSLFTLAQTVSIPNDQIDPKPYTIIHHIRCAAVLNASRLACDFNELSDESNDTVTMIDGIRTNMIHVLTDSSNYESIIQYLRLYCQRISDPASALQIDSDVPASLALNYLHASAMYLEALQTHRSRSSVITSLLGVEQGRKFGVILRGGLAHRDRSLRICILRILNCFDQENYLNGGANVSVGVEITNTVTPIASSSSSFTDATDASSFVAVLADGNLVANNDSILTGTSPVLSMLLEIEATPNTFATERVKRNGLEQLGVLLQSKRLPPLHVIYILHCSLGLMYTKFSPVWKSVIRIFGFAAKTYPRTAWIALGRYLYVASLDRPKLMDAGATAEDGGNGNVNRIEARSRSQGRTDRVDSGIVALRISALAAASASGAALDPSAMSQAGTVVSQATTASAADAQVSAVEAALAPGYEELQYRMDMVIDQGLYGADSGTINHFLTASTDRLPNRSTMDDDDNNEGNETNITYHHANDVLLLGIGEGGYADSETVHQTIMSILQNSSEWSEARNRTLFPLFLSFMRDDYYGRTFREDPDGCELQLDDALNKLLQRHKESTAKAAVRRKSLLTGTNDVTATTGKSVRDPQAMNVALEEFAKSTDELFERLVSGKELASQPGRLPKSAASNRLLAYLKLFEQFSQWNNTYGRETIEAIMVRLLVRSDNGIGESALKVLLAMRINDIVAYREPLLKLAGDKTYRDEMVKFPVATFSSTISETHRLSILAIIIRVVYGRLLQRKGRSSRDTPAARRAAVLSYLGSLTLPETGLVVYLSIRPFLLAKYMPVLTFDGKIDSVASFGMQHVPSSAEHAQELVKNIYQSFTTPEGVDPSERKYITATRAVGFLNLLHDLVRQLGNNLLPYLHHMLAIVFACLHETKVQAGTVETDDNLDTTKETDGATKTENDQDDPPSDDENDRPRDTEERMDTMDGNTPQTSLVYKAKQIRTLAIQRLHDIFNAFPSYNYQPWLNQLSTALNDATEMLPRSMVHASRPSALLQLFVTISQHSSLYGIFEALPNIVPAVCATLSAGMVGSQVIFLRHRQRVGGSVSNTLSTPMPNIVHTDNGESIDSLGPSSPVLTQVFIFLEYLLGLLPVDSNIPANEVINQMATHLPYLLEHLSIRLAANTMKPTTLLSPSSSSSSSSSDTYTEIIVPKLRGGTKAFARRQLGILSRISEIITFVRTDSTKSSSRSMVSTSTARSSIADSLSTILNPVALQQLVLLLLPYLRNQRKISSADSLSLSAASKAKPNTGKGKPNTVTSDGNDPHFIVLTIIQRLIPYVEDPRPYVPFFSYLLQPGARALVGTTRTALIKTLASLCQHKTMEFLSPAIDLLQRLAAQNPKRLDELDYDTVLGAIEEFSGTLLHKRLFASFTTQGYSILTPALLHQVAYLMHNDDMAVRTAALNCVTTIIRSAAKQSIEWWRTHKGQESVWKAVSSMNTSNESPRIFRYQLNVPDRLGQISSSDVLITVFMVTRVIMGDIRISLDVINRTIRRGFITVFSDIVKEFYPFGLEAGNIEPSSSSAAAVTHTLSHPDLYPDLAILSSTTDVEADGFLNLSHIQLYRRARALNALAQFVDKQVFTTYTIKSFILPITLHALYDESGTEDGIEIVESKGKVVKLNGSSNHTHSATTGSSSNIHFEAIKLIGSLAKQLPWTSYFATIRQLIRLAGRPGVLPTLEKVLIKGITAMTENFHFDLSVHGSFTMDTDHDGSMNEKEFHSQLILAIDTGTVINRQTLYGGAGNLRAQRQRQERSVEDNDREEDEEIDTVPVDKDTDTDKEKLAKRNRKTEREDTESVPEEAVEEEAENDEPQLENDADDDGNISSLILNEEEETMVSVPHFTATDRRSILLSLCTVLIPQLRRLLHRDIDKDAKEKGLRPEMGELRPHVVMALVRLYHILPHKVAQAQIPGLIAEVCNALRSRHQSYRDTARATLAKLAVTLGPVQLHAVLRELRDSLREGYQIHILGHALYAVMEALAPLIVPESPALPDNTDTTLPNATTTTPQDAENETDIVTEVAENSTVKTGSYYLTRSLSTVLSMIMEDIFGEAAETRDEESGYKPKTMLAEAKKCRSYETLEIVARSIPFLPNPAIHTLTAPLIAAIEDERTNGGRGSGMKGGAGGGGTDTIDALFKRILSGLSMNPSVTGPYLLLYVHGICNEFLHITTATASKDVFADEATTTSSSNTKPQLSSASSSTTITTIALPNSVQDVYAKFAKALQPRGVGKMKPVVTWVVRDRIAAEESLQGSNTTNETNTVPLSAAMRLKGSGAKASHDEIFTLAPEPKMTGTGRYVSSAKASQNTGVSTASDIPMGSFALQFLYTGLVRKRIVPTEKLHTEMLDPYVPLLLRLLQTTKENKILVMVLRLFALILPTALSMLRRSGVGTKIARAILSTVENTSGGSAHNQSGLSGKGEVAAAALKATTVMIRACEYIQITDDQLRALLHIIRRDLDKTSRHSATFALLKAIVSRRLVVAEVYDTMDEMAYMLVTSVRPTARGAAASVFLEFLLKYPMTEKRLSNHLEFFIKNLGYSVQEGRAAVLDMLQAIVTRFPQPVLDEYSSYLLLPLTVRLSVDASSNCRAMIGAIIRSIFRCVSLSKGKELLKLCINWCRKTEKAGNRRSGAHIISLAITDRPELLQTSSNDHTGTSSNGNHTASSKKKHQQSSVQLLQEILQSFTIECTRAAVDIAIMEHRLTNNEQTSLQTTMEGIALQGNEAQEDEEFLQARKANKRANAMYNGDTALLDTNVRDGVFDSDEEEDDNDEESSRNTRSFPVGTSGGGIDVFESPATVNSNTGDKDESKGIVIPFVWEPVYYTLLAIERIYKALGEDVDQLITAMDEPNLGTDRSSLFTDAPIDWRPVVNQVNSVNVIAAACNLLMYPHAWVRLAASRVLGLFLARRSLDHIQECVQSLHLTDGADATEEHDDDDMNEEAKNADSDKDTDNTDTVQHGNTNIDNDDDDHNNDDDDENGSDNPDNDDDEEEDEEDLNDTREPVLPPSSDPINNILTSAVRSIDAAATWLVYESTLLKVSLKLFAQLTSVNIGKSLSDQVAKNLVFLTLVLHSITPIHRRRTMDTVVAAGYFADKNAEIETSTTLITSSTVANTTLISAKIPSTTSNRDPVYFLFLRAYNISRFQGDVAKSTILQWIAAIALRLPKEELLRYLIPITRILYRFIHIPLPENELSTSTKTLAQEGVELITDQAGTMAFTRAFNLERERIASVRIHRKKERTLLKLVDPESAAKEKEKRQESKARQKKRKIEGFMMAKGKTMKPTSSLSKNKRHSGGGSSVSDDKGGRSVGGSFIKKRRM